ncbi:nuclear transport factor 2 family protein [Ideonella sp. DXS29W]|uniref:Nuclear transport factor 2 family protein n=1 Tax=Ideonella lacteola TaxID=2984193 RepID=A0ABU9BN22_9BURK
MSPRLSPLARLVRRTAGAAFAVLSLWPAWSAAATTEETLTAIEDQRVEAVRIQDFGTLGRIYAPEFLAVSPQGEVIDRSQLFQALAKGQSAQRFSTDDIRVLDLGATAVVFGRQTARAPTGQVTEVSRFAHVYIQRDGQWWCVSAQSTRMPEP